MERLEGRRGADQRESHKLELINNIKKDYPYSNVDAHKDGEKKETQEKNNHSGAPVSPSGSPKSKSWPFTCCVHHGSK